MNRIGFNLAIICVALLATTSNTFAQGRAEGGIIARDKTPAYMSSTGNNLRDSELPRGATVVGITTTLGIATSYQFEESDGRVQATYVLPSDGGEQMSIYRTAWFQKSDIEFFTYECGCPSTISDNKCEPFVQAGWTTVKYSSCVKDGARKKLIELRPQWERTTNAGSLSSGGKDSKEKPLTNDDILALIKTGLGDEIIVLKIQQAPSELLDVSVDSIIRLRKEGLPTTILDAMLKRASQRK